MIEKNELILVTGAGGFIGGHMVARLIEEGYERIRAVDIKPISEWHQSFPGVENLQHDLRDKESCYSAARGAAWIYNFAADMGGMGFIETHKAECMLSVLINTHLLMAARSCSVRRFLFASSACVYAQDKQVNAQVIPLAESDAYPAMAEDGYGWEKLFSERMCRHYQEDYGLETRVIRFHNVYGPNGTYDGGREKAPAAICRKVIDAKMRGDLEIEIWGDGKQTRSFMYIEDCVNGVQKIMYSNFSDPINLGSDEAVTINELVDIVEKLSALETKLKRVHSLNAPKGVRGRNSDNTLIRAVFGWAPEIPLKEGVAKTYRWIESQMTTHGGRSGSYDEETSVGPRRALSG